jgi:hypothetical protein
MKKIFLLTGICLIFSSLNGQTFYERPGTRQSNFLLNSNHYSSSRSEAVKSRNFNLKKKLNQVQPYLLKSANVLKHRLDSIVIEELDDMTSKFLKSSKEIFIYDGNQKNTLSVLYSWNATLNKYVEVVKQEYSYDGSGNILLSIFHEWDGSHNTWVFADKEERSYNASGKILSDITYEWDTSLNKWVGINKSDYSYGTNGLPATEIDNEWDNSLNKWVETSKSEFTYAANGSLTTINGYSWNSSLNKWAVNFKEEVSYDTNGNLTSDIEYLWETSQNKWVGNWKYNYTNDTQGNRTSEIEYDWDFLLNKWVEVWKYEYTYESNGNLTAEIKYEWDNLLNKWTEDDKEEFIYDNTFALNNLILPVLLKEIVKEAVDYPDGFFSHKIIEENNYSINKNTGKWDADSKGKFFYSPQDITGVDKIRKNEFTLYPNPARDYVTLDFGINESPVMMEIFDIQGKSVLQNEITGNEPIDVKMLTRGLYFYRLDFQGDIKTGKIILQ